MRDLEDEARIKAYMAAKMAHIKRYNECMNLADGLDVEKFAELVRADERQKIEEQFERRIHRQRNNYGKTMQKLLADEREACAKVCEELVLAYVGNASATANQCAEAIRTRGQKPPVKTYAGGKPNYCTPEETPEVPCKTHPDAPHGFDRNASHNADRYVCECEGWEPPEEAFTLDRGCYERGCVAYDERDGDGVIMLGKRVHKSDKSIHEEKNGG